MTKSVTQSSPDMFHIDLLVARIVEFALDFARRNGYDSKDYFSNGGCGQLHFVIKKIARCAKAYLLDYAHILTSFANHDSLFDIYLFAGKIDDEEYSDRLQVITHQDISHYEQEDIGEYSQNISQYMFNYGIHEDDRERMRKEFGCSEKEIEIVVANMEAINKDFFAKLMEATDAFIKAEFAEWQTLQSLANEETYTLTPF